MKRFLVADLFCGAGGSSTGARRALEARGARMNLVAVNHWPVAIETHQANHPDARHYCVNLDAARPTELVPEGRLDLLMASPECTHHSRARGGRPISDQSRMSAWHVVRWCTELRVRCLLVENVPEFRDWGPLHAQTRRPLRSRKGEYFRAWIAALEAIGFRCEWRVLNAADYGDATTRERFFLLARSDRKTIRWPEATHSRDGRATMFGEGAERWRPARDIIDWSIPGKSIFHRKRPLSRNTLERIYAGAMKFRWPEPYLVVLRRHMDGKSVDEPLPAITAGGTHIGLAQPMILPQNGSNRARGVDEPAPVVTTTSRGIALVHPFVLSRQGEGAPRSVDEPTPTQVAKHSHALITPYYGESRAREVADPLPTVTTRDRFGLAVPVPPARVGEHAFIPAAFGERNGQAPRVHSVDEPAPTICATGRVNLVEARGYDVLFRMLQPHELAAAMGFDAVETTYEFCGTKTEVIRQIGNAVPVRTASALVGALLTEAA